MSEVTVSPLFNRGQQIRLRSSPEFVGMIQAEPTRRQGQFWYVVFFGPGRTQSHPEEDLEAYSGDQDPRSMLRDGRFSGREALSKLFTHLKLTSDLRSQIYALFSSRTRFLPYQFKPLLKFFESPAHRLLIADEVGLGKTIEAGLILTELRQRRPDITRVLIVPPAHLCRKWQEEMRRRFDRQFTVLDSRGVLEFLRSYERDRDETPLWGIVSLQTLRGERVMSRWEEVAPEIDFVVFDEAGRLRNPDTRSHRVADLVRESSDSMLLLTATPVQTGAADLFHLLQLLDPDEFERREVFNEQLRVNGFVLDALAALRRSPVDLGRSLEHLRAVETTPLAARFRGNPIYGDALARLAGLAEPSRRDLIELQRDIASLAVFGHVLSRTRKREVEEEQPQRRARVFSCEPSSAEREFYDEVTRLCLNAYAQAIGGWGTSFGILQPQRQMASCMVAMVNYLESKLQGERDSELEDGDDGEDYSEGENGEEVPANGPHWRELGDLQEWKRRLRDSDSKFEKLVEAIRSLDREEPGAKVIVFTFFRLTVAYLQQRLAENGVSALALTGAVPSNFDDPTLDQRLAMIEKFRDDPRSRVLIATEVADEGLDLQFAHCIVNYDLPWNPMRIEQRIGRIDRIGQESKTLQIINLSMAGTIEDRILDLLYERIGIFEQSIGDLEAILGEEIALLERDLFSGHLTAREQAERIQRVAEVIERRRQETERLQAQAESLIGHDEFFLDEIDRAVKGHRYASGEELLIYLRDFLAEHHRVCRVRDVEGRPDVFKLNVTDGLRQFLRSQVPASDRELGRFLTRSMADEVVFTTDPETAEQDRALDFLTFYHPLIRALNRHYEAHADELHPVTHVQIRSSGIPEGSYAWFLYVIEITGARPQRDLELVAVRLSDCRVLDADTCQSLQWALVSSSVSVPEALRSGGVPDSIHELAEETLAGRLEEWFTERNRANDGLVANRLASLRETHDRNLRTRQQRLQTAQIRGRRDSYLRGLETSIRRLHEAYQARVAGLEAGRRMARSYKLRGGGVVEVISG